MVVVIIEMRKCRKKNFSRSVSDQNIQPISTHSRKFMKYFDDDDLGWRRWRKKNFRDGARKTKRREHKINFLWKTRKWSKHFFAAAPQMFHLFFAFGTFSIGEKSFPSNFSLFVNNIFSFLEASSHGDGVFMSCAICHIKRVGTRVENLLQQFFVLLWVFVVYGFVLFRPPVESSPRNKHIECAGKSIKAELSLLKDVKQVKSLSKKWVLIVFLRRFLKMFWKSKVSSLVMKTSLLKSIAISFVCLQFFPFFR